MPTKNEVYESIENRNYTQKEVKSLIYSISSKNHSNKPSVVKKGDVFINCHSSNKPRPYIVAKVFKDRSICIAMSTTEDFLNVCSFSCRVFGDNYFSFNTILVNNDDIRDNFCGVLEDTKSLNNAIQLIKASIEKL